MPLISRFFGLPPVVRRPLSADWRAAVAIRLMAGAALSILAIGLGLSLTAGGTSAQGRPPFDAYAGIWFDDTGKGAVEIGPCGTELCGRIAWLRSPLDERGRPLRDANNPDPRRRGQPICGLPVMGNLKPQRGGIWDEGWIYDPKVGKSYDVELKLMSINMLQVTGYLGIKLLSESFIWKRAPGDLQRCESPQPAGPPGPAARNR
jgi:uncharacterized protein (DUF2147 family)